MSNTSASRIGLHMGRVLMTLANKYPSLPRTIVEGVQNAIDADAKNIFIGVDESKRSVVIFDDGVGASVEQFDLAIATIFDSIKSKERIGKFGIGVISPVNKCSRFDFVSKSVGSLKPNRWRFVGAEIDPMREDILIPRTELIGMPKVPVQFAPYATNNGITWNTMVVMHSVTDNRSVSQVEPDELESLIRTTLGVFLRLRGITCHYVQIMANGTIDNREIRPLVYTGDPFPVYDIVTPETGHIQIELYKATPRSGKRHGEVSVSEMVMPYGVSLKNFRAQALGLGWAGVGEAFFDALGSGYFEGTIRCEKLELDPNREVFQRTDVLPNLYVALDDWFNTSGRMHYEADKELSRDERYNRLSMKVMDEIRNLLRLPEFTKLAAQLTETVQQGRVGLGHGLDGKDLTGEDDQPSTRTGMGGAGVPRSKSSSPRKGGRGDGTTRDGDIPTGVVGKGNRLRATVRDDSIGLWLEVTDLEFSSRVWEFDVQTGLLQFNSRNALWNTLDGIDVKRRLAKHDKQIMQLQKFVILGVLELLRYPLDEFEERRQFVDNQLNPFAAAFITA